MAAVPSLLLCQLCLSVGTWRLYGSGIHKVNITIGGPALTFVDSGRWLISTLVTQLVPGVVLQVGVGGIDDPIPFWPLFCLLHRYQTWHPLLQCNDMVWNDKARR